MSRLVNDINPEGYGAPIVGLFSSGRLLFYSAMKDNFQNSQGGYWISNFKLDEDDEDGVNVEISIHTNNVKLIDTSYFVKGSSLSVAIGYITKDGPKFGPPWYLVLKDFKANYNETITFDLILVDSLTFSQMDKGDDKYHKALDNLRNELEVIDKAEEDVKTPKDLQDLLIFVNKLRENVKWRNQLRVFRYYETPLLPSGPGDKNVYTFYDLDEFREFIKEKKGKEYSDHELIQSYSTSYRNNVGALAIRLRMRNSPLVDLFGNPMGFEDEGMRQWQEMLEITGVWEIVERRASEQGHPLYGRLRRVLALDEQFMDEVFQEYIDKKALQYVQQDVNLNLKDNLKKIQNQQPGGPFQISDLGRNDGVNVRVRDFNRPAIMSLVFKGGAGDLLNITFETDFYKSPITSTQAISIDGDSGKIISSEDYHFTADGHIPRSDEEVSRFIDDAVDKMIRNEELGEENKIDFDSFIKGPIGKEFTLRGPTSRAAGYNPDGTTVLPIDMTSVVLPNSLRVFYADGPSTIDKIKNEIDNRKGEIDIRVITSEATIIGRPNFRSGLVFNVQGVSSRLTGRYYCLAISHIVNPESGYICKLSLGKILTPGPASRNVTTIDSDLTDENEYTQIRKSIYRIVYPGSPISKQLNELEKREYIEPVDPFQDLLDNAFPGSDFTIEPTPVPEVNFDEIPPSGFTYPDRAKLRESIEKINRLFDEE